jgi:hypothetical protein
MKLSSLLLGAYLLLTPLSSTLAIDVTAAAGTGDAAAFASALVDAGSPIAVNSASFLIDVVGGGTSRPDYTTIESITVEVRASALAGGGPDLHAARPNSCGKRSGAKFLNEGRCWHVHVFLCQKTKGARFL